MLCPLVLPHRSEHDLPRNIILHPVPEQVALTAATPCLPKFTLEDRHSFSCADQDDRDANGVDQSDEEIQHLF